MRIVIAGVPRAGKTTSGRALSDTRGCVLRSTDDLIGTHEWSAASAEAATWLDEPGPWVIEGVAAVRALRKWLAAHPNGSPADVVMWLDKPRVKLTPAQDGMAKACRTIWAVVRPELSLRGVKTQQR